MAGGTQLILEFENSKGKSICFAVNYARPSVTQTQVNTLMQTIIDNGSIFKDVPIKAKSAKAITISEWYYNVS